MNLALQTDFENLTSSETPAKSSDSTAKIRNGVEDEADNRVGGGQPMGPTGSPELRRGVRSMGAHAARASLAPRRVPGPWDKRAVYIYLKGEKDLPPGVLAELHRRRWETEKVFDEFKNKLRETKTWSSSQEARTIHGGFVSLTHNRLVSYQRQLEARHRAVNEEADRGRDDRLEKTRHKASLARRALSTLLQTGRPVSQCRVN